MSPARRPSTHDVQDVATQKTLNYALGNLGGGQKSWMMPHQTPVASFQQIAPPPAKRKRGRPPLTSQTGPQQQAHVGLGNPSKELSHDRHPPSNSTSPQLANVVHHRPDASPLHTIQPPLPSPSPSEETILDSAPTSTTSVQNNGSPLTARAASREEAVGDDVVDSPRVTSADFAFMEEVRRAANPTPTPDKHPHVAPGHPQRVAQLDGQQEGQATRTPVLHERIVEQQHASSAGPAQTRSPSLGSHSHNTPQAQRRMQSRPSSRTQTHPRTRQQLHGSPPQPQVPFGPPRSLSRGHGQHPYSRPPAQQVPNPQTQPPVLPTIHQPIDFYTTQDCQIALQQFTAQYQVRSDRDGRRLGVLIDAVAHQDWDYLTVHQYYCLLDVDRQRLPPGLRNHPNLPVARQLLQEVLDPNTALSVPVLSFFIDFPMPIAQVAMNWPRRYEQQQQMFIHLISLAGHFAALKEVCETRRYPPLMREVALGLGITSPALQRMVFTALLRRLWLQWGAQQDQQTQEAQQRFEHVARTIFNQNQADFMHRRSTRPLNAPADYDNQERNIEQVSFGGSLQQLCHWYKEWLRRHRSSLPSLAQAAHPQQQTQQAQPPTLQSNFALNTTPEAAMPRRGRGTPRTCDAARPPQVVPSRPLQAAPSRPLQVVPSQPAPARPPNGFLLPPPGQYLPQQRVANPARFGLHQAHLRSPVLQAQSPDAGLYQFVKGFVKSPTRPTEAADCIAKWTFSVSAEDLQSTPRDSPGLRGAPPSRLICENSQIFRLRCVQWPSAQLPDEHAWAIADTAWIPHAHFKFNGEPLHPRKKLHHGKDLPVDLTSLLTHGDNTLELAIMRPSNDVSYLTYLLAIEVVGFKRHEDIKQVCVTCNRIPAPEVLDAIKRRLTGPSNDDDEIAIVHSNLTINLFDPFSASQICDLPARSRACTHIDCFDLQTFLQTRKRKGDASTPDVWRCPICNADARPQFLVVDGFLEHVRAELKQQGLLHSRAIIVGPDGTWKAKPEPNNTHGGEDRGSPDGMEARTPTAARSSTNPPIQAVIDLSD